MSNFSTFIKLGHEYQAIPSGNTLPKLPPGMYSVTWDPRDNSVVFGEMKTTHDELINLPGTAYEQIVQDLDFFLTAECLERFEFVNLLHKMNILLHGVPGGGKTCIVNRVASRVMESKGVVLFNPDPRCLKEVFRILDLLQPETRVLVIFEELDQLIRSVGEGPFLHVLDGEIQKHNAMFVATTNYLDKVPDRVRRPGRFPVRLDVGMPNLEARQHYCFTKLKDMELATTIASQTDGFSIDQLRDVIRASYCMKKDLTTVLTDLRKEYKISGSAQPDEDADWAECDEDEEAPVGLLRAGSTRDAEA